MSGDDPGMTYPRNDSEWRRSTGITMGDCHPSMMKCLQDLSFEAFLDLLPDGYELTKEGKRDPEWMTAQTRKAWKSIVAAGRTVLEFYPHAAVLFSYGDTCPPFGMRIKHYGTPPEKSKGYNLADDMDPMAKTGA